MATLERIRKRSGLLIVVIGLAMGAFILTDLLSSGGILFNDTNNMGSINGDKITRQDFIIKINKLRKSNPQYAQFSEKTMADAVWNQLERDVILGEECDNLGLIITPKELSYNIKTSPEISRAFADKNTGQFSESDFNRYYSSLEQAYFDGNDPKAIEGWLQWVAFEKGMKQQSLSNKYNTAVKYGVYIPSILGKEEYIKQSESVQGSFIQLPFSSISDSTINISDSDLKSYFNNHKSDYETEASRSFDYVAFDILPSEDDINEVLIEMSSLLEDKIEPNKVTGSTDTIIGFRNTPDDSSYVAMYSDSPFDDKFYKKDELPANIDTVAFYNEVGHVEGPELQGNNFIMYKINKIINKPDSVKARHILISYQGAKGAAPTVARTPQQAKSVSDSIFSLIKDDVTLFDTVSLSLNDDAIAKGKNGDLGWFTEGAKGAEFGKFAFRKRGDF